MNKNWRQNSMKEKLSQIKKTLNLVYNLNQWFPKSAPKTTGGPSD